MYAHNLIQTTLQIPIFYLNFMQSQGYCFLAEEAPPAVNECSLQYSIILGVECTAPSSVLSQDTVALPLSLVETLTADISIEIPLSSGHRGSSTSANEKGGEEIDTEIFFPSEKPLHEMVTIEEKGEDPVSIIPVGEGQFSMATEKKKVSLTCSSIDSGRYVVLSEDKIFLINSTCSTRIVKERDSK